MLDRVFVSADPGYFDVANCRHIITSIGSTHYESYSIVGTSGSEDTRSIRLRCTEGSSDKIYEIHIVSFEHVARNQGPTHALLCRYGKTGGGLNLKWYPCINRQDAIIKRRKLLNAKLTKRYVNTGVQALQPRSRSGSSTPAPVRTRRNTTARTPRHPTSLVTDEGFRNIEI